MKRIDWEGPCDCWFTDGEHNKNDDKTNEES